MNRDDVVPAAHLKELFFPAFAFIASSIVSIVTFFADAETWITFATAAGGFLSLARAMQISYFLIKESQKPSDEELAEKTRKALMEFAEEDEKLQRLADKAAKEASLLSSAHTKARKYPPVKKFD